MKQEQEEWEGAENKKKIDIEAIENMGYAPHNEGVEERFEDYIKSGDPCISISEAQKEWLKPFIAQEIQKVKDEERDRIVETIEKAHKDEITEVFNSKNRNDTKEYIKKGLEIYKKQILSLIIQQKRSK